MEIYHNLTEYIEAFERWTNTPAVINKDGMFVIVNGKRYLKAEFDGANPKPVFNPLPKRGLKGEPIGTPVIVKKSK